MASVTADSRFLASAIKSLRKSTSSSSKSHTTKLPDTMAGSSQSSSSSKSTDDKSKSASSGKIVILSEHKDDSGSQDTDTTKTIDTIAQIDGSGLPLNPLPVGPNLNGRIHNGDRLEDLHPHNNNHTVLTGATNGSLFTPDASIESVASGLTVASNVNFHVDIPTSSRHLISRCNAINTDQLSSALNRVITFVQTKVSGSSSPTRAQILTALAWHIAEYRPTPVTHGLILGIPAQEVYDVITNSNNMSTGYTVRQLARAWSPAISRVLATFTTYQPPIFTTQCNETFVNLYHKVAVAPYFFDGIDTSSIPSVVSRIIATGLAYSKRVKSESPFSFHKRPAFVRDSSEDFNGALQFNG
uniref:Putative movement protein n=1 Tax=Chara australis virus TaxID=1051671 RepID=F8ULT7_9VIRU|nr:putative movement protein [Chara australis virus]